MAQSPDQRPNRRGFLLGAAGGLALGVPLTALGLRATGQLQTPAKAPAATIVQNTKPGDAMPGPYPGRVVEVQHADSVRPDNSINAEAVRGMVERGMAELTGATDGTEAWRSFFEAGDVVGIKVNPVGSAPKRRSANGPVGAISSPELLLEVVKGLYSAGVKPKDIIVFERYAPEFIQAGYDKVMNERLMDGVRWYASAAASGNQLDIEGFDRGRDAVSPEMARHVVGYDPDVFVHMGFSAPGHSTKDDRRFRSHLSVIVTRLVNKMVTLPVLKDHRSAGVTIALKNMSHGMNNNVARSHLSGIKRLDGSISGPNQCNTFIPTAVSQSALRQKATLHIMDGLIGVYEGGPGAWNKTWATWPYKGLFFATDPVAMDHVGWDIVDRKRVAEGWPPVARMGLQFQTYETNVAGHLGALAGQGSLATAGMLKSAAMLSGGRDSEVFDRRQPEHIILAGRLGLGKFDAADIDHRRVELF